MALPPIQRLPPHRTQLARLVDRGASAQQPCDLRRTSMDNEDLSNSWPSATLRRHRAGVGKQGEAPVRRFLEQVPRGMTRSYESVLHPRPSVLSRTRRELPPDPPGAPQRRSPAQEEQQPFSLRLTPEAVLVIQKRSLEKQRSARRIFASNSGRCPRSSLQTSPPDVRELLKISLLNEQHRYDDMEYEEESWLGDDGLVRKCTEWLQGVELATGRGGNLHEKLRSLPHLNSF